MKFEYRNAKVLKVLDRWCVNSAFDTPSDDNGVKNCPYMLRRFGCRISYLLCLCVVVSVGNLLLQ